MLRSLTAGESHGKAIVAILEGMPAGLRIDLLKINQELKRRQAGFGRGKRMQIENDRTEIFSGLKNNLTLGSPLTLLIKNKDFSIEKLHKVLCPRPGHADLAGLLKYGFTDIREVLERASARSTVATVGIGALCKIFLDEFKIKISSRVLSIGGENTAGSMKDKITEAIKLKDTIGGIFEVRAKGLTVGLGSYVQADKRLDGRFAQAIMSIPGIKAMEIGLGLGYAISFGSEVHDAIYRGKGLSPQIDRRGHSASQGVPYCAQGAVPKDKGYFRKTNNAGGIEGGVSNGEDLVIRACMKPICTLMNPLDSVNIKTNRPSKAAVERTDTCVVSAAGVVAESACAYVLTDAMLEKFGSDSLRDIKENYRNYLKRIS